MINEHMDGVGIELYCRWKEYKTIDTPFGTIAEDWSYIPSLQFCTKITDGTHDSPKQQKSGKHLVTSKHIKGRNIDFESAYLISEKDFDNINLRSKVEQWDVIVSMIGEYCGFTYVERNINIDYAVKNVGLFKTGSEHKALWLFYYLNSKIGRHILEINKSGTSQPYLTLGFLRELPILYPSSIVEANHIIQILSSLDDKIDLLHRQNKTLEQLAETLFRQWFVEEAEENWEDKKLGDLLTITSSKRIFYSEYVSFGIPFYRSKEIIELRKSGSTNSELYISKERFDEINNKFGSPKEGDILMTSVGTLGVAYRVRKSDKFYFKDGNLTWFKDFKGLPSSIIYLWLISKIGQEELAAITIGSTQEALTIEGLKSISFKIPPIEKVKDYEIEFNSIIEKMEFNQSQIRTLTNTRDALLPKLMSGEIRTVI